MENGSGAMDTIQEFDMVLPQTEDFAKMDFSENMTAKINSVE
jgi:alpha-acetolactate decarboxylase